MLDASNFPRIRNDGTRDVAAILRDSEKQKKKTGNFTENGHHPIVRVFATRTTPAHKRSPGASRAAVSPCEWPVGVSTIAASNPGG